MSDPGFGGLVGGLFGLRRIPPQYCTTDDGADIGRCQALFLLYTSQHIYVGGRSLAKAVREKGAI